MVKICLQKNSACHFLKISNHRRIPPRPEGRFANVTNVGRDAVDADGLTDEQQVSRTAKSCGPGAPMQAPSSSEAEKLCADDGGKRWFTEESAL
jgi:hypothetical protein